MSMSIDTYIDKQLILLENIQTQIFFSETEVVKAKDKHNSLITRRESILNELVRLRAQRMEEFRV